MVLEGRSTRTARLAGAAVLAVSLAGGLAGCKSDSGTDAGKKPAADTSATGTKGQGSQASTSQPADPAGATPSGAGSASAQQAVETFVTAVIKGRPKDACLQMAQPAEGSTPAQVGSAARCNGSDPKVLAMQKSLTAMGESFKPKGLTGDPKVVVADVPPAGGKVLVPASKITVDGQPLDHVVLSHSTGLSQGQVDVKLESSEIQGTWWVTNLEFNVG